MTRARSRIRWSWRIALCAVLAGGAASSSAGPASPAGPAGSTGDEQFVESLGSGSGRVDPRRLAKLLFSVASTLDGGRSATGLLQGVISDREPGAATSRTTLANSFQGYETALARFRAEVSALVDQTDSAARLYRTLTAGYRACWQLDNYLRLVQSHGASGSEMITVLSTIESCRLFRRLAHQPRVERRILDALNSAAEPNDEVRALREELQAMEELLEDLRRIDAEEPELDR